MSPTLADVLGTDPPDFALLYRPRSGAPGRIELLLGRARTVDRLDAIALPPVSESRDGPDALVLLPYGQLAERGLPCHADETPLVVLPVAATGTVERDETLEALPRTVPVLRDGRFVPDDGGYADIVRRVRTEQIGRGEGSNFVIRRAYRATLANPGVHTALAVFRRLLGYERGAYWTFLVHTGGRTLLGASPELHVSLRDGVVTMNPISGTYRYPPGGPTVPDAVRFLADRKETEELYMVVDEELKMLGRICPEGARVDGPRLAEMAHLAHTEYTVSGRTDRDALDVLRHTMFAPTVIGSPLANACRVVARYEPHGRGYYGGAVALLGQRAGHRTLDSAILIRTADLAPDGGLEIGVGATLVRRSDPAAEVAETRAKAGGLLTAFGAADAPPPGPETVLRKDSRVRAALEARNGRLNGFWLRPRDAAPPTGERVLVVDAEDAFTAMLAHLLRAAGPEVDVVDWRAIPSIDGYDAVVVGPGPGDPRAGHEPKIAALRTLTGALLDRGVPTLAVCLGHQVLATLLGLPLRRRPVPAQGEQREIDFFGRVGPVGFYNTFAAYADSDRWHGFDLARDPGTGEVYGLRGPGVRSVQFHPESVLTPGGEVIVRDLLTGLRCAEVLAA